MGTRELEVEAEQEWVACRIFGEEGDSAPDRSWCRDYEEIE